MGLPAPVIEMIIAEHCNRAITGDVAFIGKQTTFATEKSLRYFEQKYKLKPPSNFQIEVDRQTLSALHGQYRPRMQNFSLGYQLKHRILNTPLGDGLKWLIAKFGLRSARIDTITDRCLMKFLGVDHFSTIDVSDYEGADVICDLSLPLPKSLYGKFDFIFNGSCLDNIFNPAEAMRNISRMLKPHGRLVMIEHGTMMSSPYTVFSPGWFFDFFCYNQYADCKVYHGLFRNNNDLHYGPWPLYMYNWSADKSGNSPKIQPRQHIMYLVIAEKGANSTDDLLPIQHQYRNPEFEQKIFAPQATRIVESAKRGFGISGTKRSATPKPFFDCGYLGKGVPF